MKVKVTDVEHFNRCVFDSESFLEHFPEMLTTGIDVEKMDDGFFYVMKNGRAVHDTAFFSQEEMSYLTPI